MQRAPPPGWNFASRFAVLGFLVGAATAQAWTSTAAQRQSGRTHVFSLRRPIRAPSPPVAAADPPDAVTMAVPNALTSLAALASLPIGAVERDILCAGFCAVAAAGWVRVWTELASTGRVPSTVSRKVIHAGSAPLFMMCWPLFSDDPSAQIAASMVPLLQMVRLVRAGRASESDEASDKGLVKAVSRTGARAEALGGPLLYTIVLFLATSLGWRSVAASTAICQMAVGDGLADIFGRRFGTVKWPFSQSKSLVGSLAFALSAFVASLGFIALFNWCGYTTLTAGSCAPAVLLISILCAAAELVPIADDNLTVPLTAVGLSALLLR